MLPKHIQTVRRFRLRYAVAIVAGCLTTVLVFHAGEGYFGYDEFGRINRSIDEQNRVTDYSYDEAGNIIGIRTTVTGTAPAITSVTPSSLRRGESVTIQVVGQNLLSTLVSTSDPQLRLNGLQNMQNTDTQMTFTLIADSDAILGAQQLTFSNNGGTTTAVVTVNPLLPAAYIAPGPVAVPPDSTPRQFRIRLSNADNVAHDFSFSVTDVTVATVPANVTIPAGATEAVVTVTGLKLGQTAFTFGSSEIPAQTQQLYVTNDYQAVYKTHAQPLGVVLQAPPATSQTIDLSPVISPVVGVLISKPATPASPVSVTPVVSPMVGVTLGSSVTGLDPNLASASTTFVLTIYGVELQGATAVQFVPNTDITADMPLIAADGRSLTVNVSIASTASQTQREVRVLAGTEQLPASSGWSMLFRVTP